MIVTLPSEEPKSKEQPKEQPKEEIKLDPKEDSKPDDKIKEAVKKVKESKSNDNDFNVESGYAREFLKGIGCDPDLPTKAYIDDLVPVESRDSILYLSKKGLYDLAKGDGYKGSFDEFKSKYDNYKIPGLKPLDSYSDKPEGVTPRKKSKAPVSVKDPKSFSKIEEAVDYFNSNDNRKQWQSKLKSAEEEAVSSWQGGSNYVYTNDYLRGGLKGLLNRDSEHWEHRTQESRDKFIEETKDYVKNLCSAADKFELDTPLKVYRGCTMDIFDKLKEGEVFIDEGFQSTAMVPGMCEDFVERVAKDNGGSEGGIVFEIDVPPGKGRGFYYNQKENPDYEPDPDAEDDQDTVEFTLNRASKMKIGTIEKNDKGYYIVKAQVID